MEGALDFNVDLAIGESKSMAEYASMIEASPLLFEQHIILEVGSIVFVPISTQQPNGSP